MNPTYRAFGAYRFVLAFLVLLSHTFPLSTARDNFVHLVGLGNIAVMSFFVLSGFIITEATTTFYSTRPVAFITNRFWRIAPPYWAALLVSIAIHAALWPHLKFTDYDTPPFGMFEWRNTAANFIAIFPRPGRLSIDTLDGFYGFVRFFWAVYIEAAFYLTVFATLLLSRIMSAKIATVFMITLMMALHVVNDYITPVHYELTYVPYFALGVLLYFSEKNVLARGGAVVTAVLAGIHFLWYAAAKPPKLTLEIATQLHVATAFALLIASVIVLLMLSQVRTPQWARADKLVGELSYPLYLNHYAALIAVMSLMPDRTVATQTVAIVAAVGLSWMLALAVDRPLVPLRDRWRGKRVEPPRSKNMRSLEA